jgi:NAD-dependent SIR2 family protein deacetylase
MAIDQTVLVVGAGFSSAAKIPTTQQLLKTFIAPPPSSATPKPVQTAISDLLKKYWADVFGWQPGGPGPSFEDHFTSLDLSANTGHHLGRLYPPAALRAIRRLSIHRVFETLDSSFELNPNISKLLYELLSGSDNAVISTNWDIVLERHLGEIQASHDYVLPIEMLDRRPVAGTRKSLPILKLHGSSNWCYCDNCRRLFQFPLEEGKGAYKSWLFLEPRDTAALPNAKDVLQNLDLLTEAPECPYCQVRLSARVATFSFDKALGFYQFQGVWEEALRKLRTAKRWIFIGYSIPEADFELRHLFKTAQLAGQVSRRMTIEVVLQNDSAAASRYRKFFGQHLSAIETDGFDQWMSTRAQTSV